MVTAALAFAALALVLWMASVGYLLALAVRARARRPPAPLGAAALPSITVVMAARDEAERIEATLANLLAGDYPADRLRVVVAAGDSRDDTAARVAALAAADPRVSLLRVETARIKADQMRVALATVRDAIVVAMDADARLAPDCLRQLVGALCADPDAAVVGAWVEPDTALREERLHWALLNRLWWLEGEAIGAAGVSGVCYAMRRNAVAPPLARGEDIGIALAAGAHGHRVRLCRAALARETRVPQSLGELLRFRLRRGRDYLDALDTAPRGQRGWRLARAVRRFHFRVTPLAALALAGLAVPLADSPAWPLVLGTAAAFALPLAAVVAAVRARADSVVQLAVALVRLLLVTWLAMLVVPRRAAPLTAARAPAPGRAPAPDTATEATLGWQPPERSEG
ncbi:MAG: glycosyltransferase [Deltaproteobacteria bacterium]|nr:glycosyltransferase [Deltaproteobacteria bacterium]